MKLRPRVLLPIEVRFLRAEIGCGDARRCQRALQELCRLHREAAKLPPNERRETEVVITGTLFDGGSDERVRRWALNALSIVGSRDTALPAITQAMAAFEAEPQVVAAAIAAIFSLDKRNAQKLIASKDAFDPKIVALSALQTAEPKYIELGELKVDIEKDDALVQKLALVNVGLQRAPQFIFDPKYENREIVRILGRDGEPIVSQYAVWATAENDDLSTSDLGIAVSKIDDQPSNVRSYIFRLYASEKVPTAQRHEVICQGMEDEDPKARLGLAIGLKDAFYDGLDAVALDWFVAERDDDVRGAVLDHIIRNAHASTGYKDLAIEIFEAEQQNASRRDRMFAMAGGREIARDFRKIVHSEEEGLFGPLAGASTVNNTFNNYGSVQGATSLSGTSTNSGPMNNSQNVQAMQVFKQAVEDALIELPTLQIDRQLETEARSALEDAKSSPSKEKVNGAIAVLEKVKDGLGKVADSGDAMVRIGGYIAALSAMLS